MVKPDGVHQNLTGAVLAFLAGHGFRPLSAVTIGLTPALRSRLYATTRTGGQLDWDLNAVLYTLGPVTAVLLRGRPGAAAYLSSGLKGHFLPTRARPDTLRGSLNAMNPVFNLVHASDDEEELAREVPVLFGRDVASVLAAPSPPVPSPGPARPLDHWRVVGDVVARLLRPGAPDAGWRLLHGVGWPDAGFDRRAAFEAVRRARDRLVGACGEPAVAAGLPALLAGRPVSLPPAAGTLPSWHSYLACTTLRYVDLCLSPAGDR